MWRHPFLSKTYRVVRRWVIGIVGISVVLVGAIR